MTAGPQRPEWPEDAYKIYANGDREDRKVWAIADFWEARCRLAVEALRRYEQTADHKCACITLEQIGPLPPEHPHD